MTGVTVTFTNLAGPRLKDHTRISWKRQLLTEEHLPPVPCGFWAVPHSLPQPQPQRKRGSGLPGAGGAWRLCQQVGPRSKVWHRMVKTDPKLWHLITLKGGGFDRKNGLSSRFQVKGAKSMEAR